MRIITNTLNIPAVIPIINVVVNFMATTKNVIAQRPIDNIIPLAIIAPPWKPPPGVIWPLRIVIIPKQIKIIEIAFLNF